MSVNLSLML